MTIACAQFAPEYRNIEANLRHINAMTASTEADICIFPELALTGYFFQTIEEIAPLAQPRGGEYCRVLSEIARSHETAIIVGFLEEENGRYFNAALAFDSKGALAGHYRKVHLFYYEKKIFTAGDLGFPVVDIGTRNGSIRLGMLVCYDWRFPEAARTLALHGAELITIPSNIVTTTGMLHTTLQTRAFENKVVLAFADLTGTETLDGETLLFRGESAIVQYNGDVLSQASADGTEVITARVHLEKTREKQINRFNDIFLDRTTYRL